MISTNSDISSIVFVFSRDKITILKSDNFGDIKFSFLISDFNNSSVNEKLSISFLVLYVGVNWVK